MTDPVDGEQLRLAKHSMAVTLYNACAHVKTHCEGSGGLASFQRALSGLNFIGMTQGGEGPGVSGVFGGSGIRRGGCNCFLAGTDVEMADGTTKDIEDIRVGDKVLSTDPLTGETTGEAVTRLIATDKDKQFNELTLATSDGTEQLTATYEHPFWSPSENNWIQAGDLKPGTTLRTDDGAYVTVTANRSYTGHARTYNLTVADLHTYYVLAGSTPVLVHNSGPCGISTRNERAGDIGNYTDSQKTRDPASQWYHEELSNEELLDGINNPGAGDGILVSRDGKILGGHHRKDELLARIRDGRIDPDTPIRIDVYDGE
jgi:hypothetical protein